MIRIAGITSSWPRGTVLLALCLGLLGGAAIGLSVQSRPAPAAIESVPESPSPPRAASPRTIAATLPAEVLRVIDGDTFEARVHVWPGIDITTKIRLRGIDAAELRARCPAELAQAEAARDALAAMLADGVVTVSSVAPDKYGGRVVADASTRSVANISAEMLGRGLARRYGGGHRDGWCDGRP
jgi:endonuclease YncB( thermonuclease family)